MKKNISKRMISALLVVCLTLALCPITALATDKNTGTGATTAAAKTSSFSVTNTLKGFGVNQLASRGLSAAATLLSWAAEESGNEDFQEAVSFINQWVFGVSDSGIGDVKELCNQILSELDTLERSMNSQFAHLESLLTEQQRIDYAHVVNTAWRDQVQQTMNNVTPGMYEAVEAYRQYFTLALECGPNGSAAQKGEVETARKLLYTKFTTMIDEKYSYTPELSSDEYYLQKVYKTVEIDHYFTTAIDTMLGELLITGDETGGSRYIDLAAQLAFLTCPDSTQQAAFVDKAIQKQANQIMLTMMTYMEFMNMRAEHFRTLDDPGLDKFYNSCRDDMYRLLVGRCSAHDLDAGTISSYGSVVEAMERWMNGKIYLDPDGSSYIYLDDYFRSSDEGTVTFTNTAFQTGLSDQDYVNKGIAARIYNGSNRPENGWFYNNASLSKEKMNFRKCGVVAKNPNGGHATVQTFYILEGDARMMSALWDYVPVAEVITHSVVNQAHYYIPTCDYYNMAQGTFTAPNGTICRLATPEELRQIMSSFTYARVGSTPAGYFGLSADVPLYLLSGNATSRDKESPLFSCDKYYVNLPLFDLTAGHQISDAWSPELMRPNELSENARFTIILKGEQKRPVSETNKVSVTVTGNGNVTTSISGKHYDAKTGMAQSGSNLTITLTPDERTVFSGYSIKLHYPNGERNDEILFTWQEYHEYIDPQTRELTLNIRAPYRDAEIIIDTYRYPDNPYQSATDVNNDGVYEIANAEQLLWFAFQVRDGYSNARAVLTSDIDLSKVDWEPLGSSSHPFNGSFDGQGHVITGLNFDINVTAYPSLFDTIGTEGAVENLGIDNTWICDSFLQIATIAATNHGTVKNCYNNAKLKTANKAAGFTGGIVGVNEQTGVVTGCCNTGSVSGWFYTGGIVGKNAGLVSNCCNTGEVYSWKYAGGIVGINADTGVVTDCYNVGSLNGNTGIGGLAGTNNGEIANCYQAGSLSAAKSLGRFSGTGTGSTHNCYCLASTDDGIGGKTADQFASGEVCWLLNGSASDGIWKQAIGTDAFPAFAGGTVYMTQTGTEAPTYRYTNEP